MSTAIQEQVVDLQEYRDIKSVLEANIRSFIKHGDARRRLAMHTVINAVMSNHNRQRMSFGSFEVIRGEGNYITIRALKHMAKSVCPGCGRELKYSDMTLIQIQEEGYISDLVAWGCKRCGEIFTRLEYTGGGLDGA